MTPRHRTLLRVQYAAVGACLTTLAACAGDAGVQPGASVPPAIVEITKTENATVFVGEGRLSHAPEYVELAVQIQAECHPTPMAASAAADKAAATVMTALRGTLDRRNARDGVFSNGGYTRGFERYISGSQTVCRGTFAKTVTVVAKTSRIAYLQTHFSQLQHDLLSGALQAPSPTSARAVTYATLSEPKPQLYYETRERLEQAALADALINARDKVEATLASGCGARDYDILRMVETSPDAARPIAYARSQPGGEQSTLELDAIWINKLLDVSFMVSAGRCGGRRARTNRSRGSARTGT